MNKNILVPFFITIVSLKAMQCIGQDCPRDGRSVSWERWYAKAWDKYGLKGKVRSVTEDDYKAPDSTGTMDNANVKIWHNEYNFTRKGQATLEAMYDGNGRIISGSTYGKTISKYDGKGREIASVSFNETGLPAYETYTRYHGASWESTTIIHYPSGEIDTTREKNIRKVVQRHPKIIRTTEICNGGKVCGLTENTYDNKGNWIVHYDSSENWVSKQVYKYNANNQLTESDATTINMGMTNTTQYLNKYDDKGRLVEYDFGNQSIVYIYNDEGRLKEVCDYNSTGPVRKRSYKYDSRGDTIQIDLTCNKSFYMRITRTYDDKSNVVHSRYYNSDTLLTSEQFYGYDKKGDKVLDEYYTYDRGNLYDHSRSVIVFDKEGNWIKEIRVITHMNMREYYVYTRNIKYYS